MSSTIPAIIPSPVLVRRKLLGWYKKQGRHDLPWRGAFNPYHVLVSEFMLQQTTVSTVIPYFHRFMEAFPTVEALAAAPLERVMELWSGLGYYARARNLHASARLLVEKYRGHLPATREEVEELPGVGRYTAGALLSFIHDKPEALVDGNVIRVISRLYGIQEDVKDPKTQEKIWAVAWKLVPPKGGVREEGARHFNSALMDFGATVCRPSGPDCLVCPLFAECWARRNGKEEELPRVALDRPKKQIVLHAGLISLDGRWSLARRPPKGLYANMWEFPTVELPARAPESDVARALEKALGTPLALERRLPSISHTLTHREISLHPWRGTAPSAGDGPWFTAPDIARMAVSSLTRKLLSLLPE
jgi:A/G-specific adenine glycosylase